MRSPDQFPSDDDAIDSVPEGLARDLAALGRAPRVPASIDAKVLNRARAHLAGATRGSRFRRLLPWAGGAAAAAAVVLVVMRIGFPGGGFRNEANPALSPQADMRPRTQGDVNGDGRVDVLDAYKLAKKVERADPAVPWQPWEDVTGDKLVNEFDVKKIAATAVQLGPTEVSIVMPAKREGSAQ